VVRIDFTIEVERSAPEVFDYLSDVERLPEWQASALESHAEGPLAEGSRIVERRKVMGREITNELEVTAYDPPRRLTLKALGGPVRFTVDHELAETGASTSVHVVAEAESGTFMKLAEPLLARTAEQELRQDFARLKEILESGGYRERRIRRS
jgi:carbon monoxide dehydrogenase subunit G